MTPETRAYLRKLAKMIGDLSAYLTAASEYSEREEHYDAKLAKRLEDRVKNVPEELKEIASWAEQNMPASAVTNGRAGQ